MEIVKTQEGSEVTLELIGELDTEAAPQLEAEIEKLSEGDSLVLELERLEYIASSGLRKFVAAHKKLGGKLVLRHVSNNLMGILKTTRLDKRITIEN